MTPSAQAMEPAWERRLRSLPADAGEALVHRAASSSRAPHIGRLVPPGGVVLDAGSGDGKFVLFAERRLGARALGLDAAPSAVERGRRAAAGAFPGVRFLRGDVRRPALEDASVDVYLSMGVIEHFSPPEQADILSEAARILKPGGVAFLTVPNLWSPWTPVRAAWSLVRRLKGRPLPWQRNITLGRLQRMTRAAGLEVAEAFHLDLPAAFDLAFGLSHARIGPVPNLLYPARHLVARLARRLERPLGPLAYHAVVVARKEPNA